MTIDEIIEHFGSLYRVCKVLNIATQNGYIWRRKGYIPINQQFRIAEASNGVLKADTFDPRTEANEK